MPHRAIRSAAGKVAVLIAELARSRDPVGVSDLARRTGLSKTTVHRLLSELVAHGMVERPHRQYRLSHSIDGLPHAASTARLRKVLKPFVLELYETTGQVVSMAVAEGHMARFLDVLYPRRHTEVLLGTAAEVPLHCTASGKALLAFDPALADRYLRSARLVRLTRHSIGTLRELDAALVATSLRGVALDQEEHVAGFWGIAAPVQDSTGTAVAALGLSGPVRGFAPADHVAALRRIAKESSAAVRQFN